MRNILTSSLELNNFKIATIEASVSETEHASVTVPTLARGYRKGDTVTLLSGGNIVIKTEDGDILGYIEISLDTGASIYEVGFNIVSSMVVNTEYPLTEDINYIYYIILYTPPTKRLSLSVETDGQPSSDGMWIDDRGEGITYLELPVDVNGVRVWQSFNGSFIAQYNDGTNFVTFYYLVDDTPGSLVNFDRIEYRDSSDNLIGIFDLSQSGGGHQILPLDETGMGIQNNDKMVMVFESGGSGGCASTYTKTSIQNGATILSTVQTYLNAALSANTISIDAPSLLNYVALGDDNNYYFFVNVTWNDASWNTNQWCIAIKCSSTGTDIEYGRAQDQESSGGRRQVNAIFNNGDEWSLSGMGYSSWQDMGEGICSYINA